NARATGFGLSQAAGRAGAAIAILAIPLIQNVWSTTAVFVAIAIIVAIAAFAVTQVGPEARGLALDEVAPPSAGVDAARGYRVGQFQYFLLWMVTFLLTSLVVAVFYGSGASIVVSGIGGALQI